MHPKLILVLMVKLIPLVSCEANLHLIKRVERNFTPLNPPSQGYYSVEEKVGAHFSLLCELVFSGNEVGYDGHISWMKKSKNSTTLVVDFERLSDKNLIDIYDASTPSELNKAEKKFSPLKLADNGSYICFTIKYKRYITLDLLVRSDERIAFERTSVIRESMFCSDSMFKCSSNGLCIIPHYVCDGKPDCKDGSDEAEENCNGDPCKDKLKCEDGRCIPTAWCCDRHRDANCTVTNRPKCCQILAETYEELEYGIPNLTSIRQSNGNSTSAKYLFISICILSILFSLVILLLILSKVMMFAKKTALQQQARNGGSQGDLAFYSRGRCHQNISPYVYNFRSSRWNAPGNGNEEQETTNADSVDPVLNRFLTGYDRPPAYGEFNERIVVGTVGRYSEPPPPYTSTEVLND